MKIQHILSGTIVIDNFLSGHENVFGSDNVSGLFKIWKVFAMSWASSSEMRTCNQAPCATYGCSASTSVPVTELATNVIAVSPNTDLNVKCLPCFTLPLKNKTITINARSVHI